MVISADTVSRIPLYPSLLCDRDANYARRLRRGEQIPRGVHTLNNDMTTLGTVVLQSTMYLLLIIPEPAIYLSSYIPDPNIMVDLRSNSGRSAGLASKIRTVN